MYDAEEVSYGDTAILQIMVAITENNISRRASVLYSAPMYQFLLIFLLKTAKLA
jgi:hypothetical protein